jgi:ubiquitin C-terminal hydrolase
MTLTHFQLQRFEYKQGRHDRAASKIDDPVHFPLQLNMLPYTNRIKGRDNKDLERSCTYDLLSVVVHVGEIETGHYMSYCRVGDQVRTSFCGCALLQAIVDVLFADSHFQVVQI